MIINKSEHAITAVAAHQFPKDGFLEIAFAGKSNVGKSSLINAMLGRKGLARTSGTPGKTRAINFYSVFLPSAKTDSDDLASSGNILVDMLYFVDLPGYGYAKVSKSESAKWGNMIEGYLKQRKELKTVLLLVDIRRDVGSNDLMLYDWFKYYSIPTIIVATKSDKLSKNEITKNITNIKNGLNQSGEIIPFSSKTKEGRDKLWSHILKNIREVEA